jgi:tRNA(Ile)-lysidine synthase
VGGMPGRGGVFRRPLLDLPRTTVRAAADVLGLAPWDDPHNDDPRFARARVRRSTLPALEGDLGPGVAEALARTARLARADADALDEWAALAHAEATSPGAGGALAIDALTRLPEAIRSRVVRRAALAAGAPAADLTAEHVERVCRLLDEWHGQRGIDLPGRVRARRYEGSLRFEQPPAG